MNNNYYWIPTILFLCFCGQLFGQNLETTASDKDFLTSDKDFLKDYVPPNYEFQLLSINPSFRESISRSENYDRDRIAGSFYGNYNYRAQKDKSDTDIRVFLRTDLVSDKVNDNKNDNDNFFDIVLDSYGDYYHYLSGEAFASVGYQLESSNRFLYLADDDNSSKQTLSIPISIGFGRPYNVSHAWSAMSLFNDLECYGIAGDRNSTKEVSDLIVTQANTRFRDNRLGRIQNRAELIEYLDANDIVDMTAMSTSVIHDTRRFETYRQRLSGFRINGGVIPKITTINRGNGNASPQNDRDFGLDPFINIDYFLPISEDWQLDAGTYVVYESTFFAEDLAELKTSTFASLAWLPNLRTNASTQLNFTTFNNDLGTSANSLSLNFEFGYYVSPQIRWYTGVYFSKIWRDVAGTDADTFSQVFSGGLTYNIL